MSRKILIVDDEPGIRAALSQLLEYEGYAVRQASNAVDALGEYAKFTPDLVFMDVKMAGIDGLEALKRLREQDPRAIVVMISGHGTIQTAVEATQLGAYDFLEKPLDTDRILVTLRNALQHLENVRAVPRRPVVRLPVQIRDPFRLAHDFIVQPPRTGAAARDFG